jgi:hypothetical protein
MNIAIILIIALIIILLVVYLIRQAYIKTGRGSKIISDENLLNKIINMSIDPKKYSTEQLIVDTTQCYDKLLMNNTSTLIAHNYIDKILNYIDEYQPMQFVMDKYKFLSTIKNKESRDEYLDRLLEYFEQYNYEPILGGALYRPKKRGTDIESITNIQYNKDKEKAYISDNDFIWLSEYYIEYGEIPNILNISIKNMDDQNIDEYIKKFLSETNKLASDSGIPHKSQFIEYMFRYRYGFIIDNIDNIDTMYKISTETDNILCTIGDKAIVNMQEMIKEIVGDPAIANLRIRCEKLNLEVDKIKKIIEFDTIEDRKKSIRPYVQRITESKKKNIISKPSVFIIKKL